jgi:3'-phosphoadenosine 5'-phosphosulfate sulfotransferase (PAPS reductase)/FAD synthetase
MKDNSFLNFIRNLKRNNIVSVSGGKDSTALLLLAVEFETPYLDAVFCDTGNEHEITYEYVRYLEEAVGVRIQWVKADFTENLKGKARYIQSHWANDGISQEKIDRAVAILQPTGNQFLDLCLWKGRFPSTMVRFCTQELKIFPATEQVYMPLMEKGRTVYSWQGVRRDESKARSKLPLLEEVGGGLWHYRPILDWDVADVFKMHKRHGIKPNPLYTQGMGRVGCMPCIGCRKDELLEISKRFPTVISRISEWEALVKEASKQDGASFFYSTERGENIHAAVRWSQTKYGGKIIDQKRLEEPETCSSAYGLCE